MFNKIKILRTNDYNPMSPPAHALRLGVGLIGKAMARGLPNTFAGTARDLTARPRVDRNPVSKKWQLVTDFTEYPYSSASFYENGIKRYDKLLHVSEVW